MDTLGCTPRPIGASIWTLALGLPVRLKAGPDGAPKVLAARPVDSGPDSACDARGATAKTIRAASATSLPFVGARLPRTSRPPCIVSSIESLRVSEGHTPRSRHVDATVVALRGDQLRSDFQSAVR